MSKKRKHPSRVKGGRYTPPGGSSSRRRGGLGQEGGFSISGTFDDDEDDDRHPVTLGLPRYGSWTAPSAFAFWLHGDDRFEQFDAFICERRLAGTHGDVHSAFIESRDDVPEEVRAAVEGFGEYMDEHFGPPL